MRVVWFVILVMAAGCERKADPALAPPADDPGVPHPPVDPPLPPLTPAEVAPSDVIKLDLLKYWAGKTGVTLDPDDGEGDEITTEFRGPQATIRREITRKVRFTAAMPAKLLGEFMERACSEAKELGAKVNDPEAIRPTYQAAVYTIGGRSSRIEAMLDPVGEPPADGAGVPVWTLKIVVEEMVFKKR